MSPADEPTIAVAATDPQLRVRPRRHPAARSPRTRRTRYLAAVVVVTLLAAGGCTRIPYDLSPPVGADIVVVDADGTWTNVVTGEVVWEGPVGFAAVPGDYDGLRGWEPAVYDHQTGIWTTAGDRGEIHFPAPPDLRPGDPSWSVPVPADYDGDGRTEPAFYVPDSGIWVIEGLYPFRFGRSSDDPTTPVYGTMPVFDVPVPADFDGDGDDDPALYRVDTGELLVWQQATIDTGHPFGFPATGDYHDAPGAEAGVAPVNGGDWWIEGWGETPSGTVASEPGKVHAAPLPADYDGDGDTNIATRDSRPGHRGEVVFADGTPTVEAVAGRTIATQAAWITTNLLPLIYFYMECVSGTFPSDPDCP